MQGPLADHVYNYMPDGTAVCVISDIPIDFSKESGAVSSSAINSMISAFGINGLNISYEKEAHFASTVHLPVQIENDFGDTFSIKIVLDDKMDNWWTLYRYGRTLMAPNDGFPTTDISKPPFRHGAYAQRRMTIPYVEVRIGDGSLELTNVFKFKRCYLKSLGNIDFNFGGQGTVVFDATFTYDNIEFKRIDKNQETPDSIGD